MDPVVPRSSTITDKVSVALSQAVRAKRVWNRNDEPPSALEQVLANGGSEGLAALASMAEGSIEVARLAALLVVNHPDWAWPAYTLGPSIAHRIGKDASEPRAVRYEALLILVEREPGLVEHLLQELVLKRNNETMEVVILSDLADKQRACPVVFLEALKRVAAVPGQSLVLTGLLFRGYADLPPQEDDELLSGISRASERFDDTAWIRRCDEKRVLELLGDVLSLAGVLLRRDVFATVLERTCDLLMRRDWHGSVAAALVSPLVKWKGEVEEVAPWMEGEYEARLLRMADSPIGPEVVDLVARMRSGHYRQLKRNAVVERKQSWRRWASQRISRPAG